MVTVPVSYILDNFFLNICDNLTLISFVLVSSSGKGDDADFYYHSLYSVLKKELLNHDIYFIASGKELMKFDNLVLLGTIFNEEKINKIGCRLFWELYLQQ